MSRAVANLDEIAITPPGATRGRSMHEGAAMSASDSVRASLGSMDLIQLVLLFVALFAYGLALSESFPARLRGAAAVAALAAAAGFAAATPRWADGIVLLAVAVALLGAFAGAAWVLARVLRLDAARGARIVDAGSAPDKLAAYGPGGPPPRARALPSR